jgi:predicted dehydrogenase
VIDMRFGLFGTGHWAEHTHGAALMAHPDVELVGVWGRDRAKADALAAKLAATAGATAVARGYADIDELIADVDAIAVALPPDVQAAIAVRAARAGRHLLLDKPLALTVADADEVVEAVAASGVASVVFFTTRFDPGAEEQLAQARETGGWSSASVSLYASIFAPENPYSRSAWRREHGGLWDIGPHALSRLLPLLGPVETVTSLAGSHHTAHVLMRHQGGAVSTMALTLEAPTAAVSARSALYGDAGVIELPRGTYGVVPAFGNAISQLLAQVDAGVPGHPCDVRFGRQVVAVLAAAQQSQLEGRAITPA